MKINSYMFPKLYKGLGVNIADLGCVMLTLEPKPLVLLSGIVAEDDAYVSTAPDLKHVDGINKEAPHLTLLYGLLNPGRELVPSVDMVLDGWDLPTVTVTSISAFPSPRPEAEPYSCIIGKVALQDDLLEGHQRLSLLPHVNTYGDWTPHVTIAYVKAERAPDLVRRMSAVNNAYGWTDLRPTGLDYGRQMRA